MDPIERPSDFHPQEWIIIVEALAQWAGPPVEAEGRRSRAYELIEAIAENEGLPAEERLRQVQGPIESSAITGFSVPIQPSLGYRPSN